ncbi:galactose-3-O-sulfotransferase 2-like [Ruditapes philippinarum]|uniref:galactose-3-O-sulfotransferase 2-like n=1 Tax=Ruditapes philippinarum TaxID=129788 RepID=UPI00295B1B37|nr:galactose-3-O-sulfotransferase 2-like [Ruditapes philippinarum]
MCSRTNIMYRLTCGETPFIIVTLMVCIPYAAHLYFTRHAYDLFIENRTFINTDNARKRNQYFSDVKSEMLSQTNESEKWKHISFLKVPKSGSSTTACIFIRFGINNNLSLFLPKRNTISEKMQQKLIRDNKHYDIFVIHTKYNYLFFSHIVKNSKIIGTIRKPETRLVSHAFYFRLYKKYPNLYGLSDQAFINKVVMDTPRYNVHNIMGSYFGLNNQSITRQSLQKKLEKLNIEFACVLIMEKFDESLIILKRLLRWSFFDIIYAPKKTKHNDGIYLNERQIKHLEQTNNIEYAIYNYFYIELERKIQNAGHNFVQEVAHFKQILNQTRHFCKNKRHYKASFYTFQASEWDDSFSVSKSDCIIIFNLDVVSLKAGRYTKI